MATQRRRDRHGRGLRGPMVPQHLPAARTRGERFHDLVLDAADRLARLHAPALDAVEFATQDVPPSGPAPWEGQEVPLGRLFPAAGSQPARIVLYRRPLETRATDDAGDLAALVHQVVAEQVAHLLGKDPDDVDPH